MTSRSRASEVKELIRKVVEFVDKAEFYPRRNVYSDIAVLALLSKSLVVGKATCLLAERKFYEEAFGLSRTLIDIYFTIRYITNRDCEERSRAFTNFFAKDHEGWGKIINKFYPAAQLSQTPEHEAMLQKAKEYKHPHLWTGKGNQTRHMAMEDDTHELDQQGRPLKGEFDYEVVYKWTSHYVHGSVIALDSHVVEPSDCFIVHGRKAQGDHFEDTALFNTVCYLNRILICALRKLGDEFPIGISNEFASLRKSF